MPNNGTDEEKAAKKVARLAAKLARQRKKKGLAPIWIFTNVLLIATLIATCFILRNVVGPRLDVRAKWLKESEYAAAEPCAAELADLLRSAPALNKIAVPTSGIELSDRSAKRQRFFCESALQKMADRDKESSAEACPIALRRKAMAALRSAGHPGSASWSHAVATIDALSNAQVELRAAAEANYKRWKWAISCMEEPVWWLVAALFAYQSYVFAQLIDLRAHENLRADRLSSAATQRKSARARTPPRSPWRLTTSASALRAPSPFRPTVGAPAPSGGGGGGAPASAKLAKRPSGGAAAAPR